VEHSFSLDVPGWDSDSVNSSAGTFTCGLIEDRVCGAPEGPNEPSGFFVNFPHNTFVFNHFQNQLSCLKDFSETCFPMTSESISVQQTPSSM
jgi:hypothetical protein